jgi:ABC-2 type transport system permease protein
LTISSQRSQSTDGKGNVDVILEIPNHFERLLTENKTTLSVSINAIDGAAAGVENVYISNHS